MSWSTSFVCPDCMGEYVVEGETFDDFMERHLETCLVYDGD